MELHSGPSEPSAVPVRGGVLRHVVRDGKKRPSDLLVDIAFAPSFLNVAIGDTEMVQVIIELTLEFMDDYLSMATDRNTRIESQKFEGPREDIGFSLDGQNQELMTSESRLDLSESVLSSLKKGKKMKSTRRGVCLCVCVCVFVHVMLDKRPRILIRMSDHDAHYAVY